MTSSGIPGQPHMCSNTVFDIEGRISLLAQNLCFVSLDYSDSSEIPHREEAKRNWTIISVARNICVDKKQENNVAVHCTIDLFILLDLFQIQGLLTQH